MNEMTVLNTLPTISKIFGIQLTYGKNLRQNVQPYVQEIYDFKQILIDMNVMKGGYGVNAQSFQLPPEMSKVISSTITDTVNGEILFCHDPQYLFAAKVTKTSGNVVFQRFNLPNIQKIIPIIKNYFIAIFGSNKFVIFQVWFNQQAKIMLKYVFNKNEKMYSCYFLREVVQNMAQLQISYPQGQIYVYQFTVNGKVGHMNYVLGPQNKIKADRQQLYGSKTIVCPQKKSLYYFTNFSNKFVNSLSIAKLQLQLSEQYKSSMLACVCLPKIEQHYIVMSNLVAVNIANNLIRCKISVDQAYIEDVSKLLQRKDLPTFSVSTYFDMIMISDSQLEKSAVFQIKQKGSAMIAIQYGDFNWFWTSTRKLVGLSVNRNSFKLIENLRLNSKNAFKQQTIQFVIDQKGNDKQKLEKEKDIENRSDDFLVKASSSKDLLDNKEQLEDAEVKNQVHSYGTLPQKKVQSTFSEKVQPKQEKQQILEPKQKFVPNKIIQKKGVSVSKILSKSKEIEPMTKSQQSKVQQPKAQQPKTQQPKAQQTKAQQSKVQQSKGQLSKTKEEITKIEEQNLAQQIQPEQKESLQWPQISKCNQKNQIPIKIDDNLNQNGETDIKQQVDRQEQVKKDDQIIQKEEQNQFRQKEKESQKENDVNQPIELPQQKVNEKEQEKSNQLQDNLTKNVALMIQKNSIAGLTSSFSSIDRNKIFSSASAPLEDKGFLQSLRKHQSQSQQYYNPFLSYSPLQTVQNEKEVISAKKQNLLQRQSQGIKKEEQVVKVNTELIEKLKQLFQTTTNRLLKSIQDVGNINNSQAYLKEKVRQQIQKKVLQTIKNHVNGQLTNRLQLYFKEIFRQTSAVQEQSIKFYKQAASHKSSHIQVQLGNQEKVLKEIKDIESMVRLGIGSLRAETSQIYQNLMRQWTAKFKESKEIIDNIILVKNKLEEESIEKAKRYQEIKKNLDFIKNKLIQKSTLQEERRNKKIEMKNLKLKEQNDKKMKKQKKKQQKQSYEKDRKSKVKKNMED